jgi:hypothetical protein
VLAGLRGSRTRQAANQDARAVFHYRNIRNRTIYCQDL